MEFVATYPYEKSYPHKLSVNELAEYKGNFGCSLKVLTKEEQKEKLPSYARSGSGRVRLRRKVGV